MKGWKRGREGIKGREDGWNLSLKIYKSSASYELYCCSHNELLLYAMLSWTVKLSTFRPVFSLYHFTILRIEYNRPCVMCRRCVCMRQWRSQTGVMYAGKRVMEGVEAWGENREKREFEERYDRALNQQVLPPGRQRSWLTWLNASATMTKSPRAGSPGWEQCSSMRSDLRQVS